MAHNSAGAARWLADAFRQHQAGQWREAEAGYRRVLSAQPRHARCLYLLGSLLAQQRQFERRARSADTGRRARPERWPKRTTTGASP